MLWKLVHWYKKRFRGPVHSVAKHNFGTIRTYRSGYTELTTPDGECVDCLLAVQAGRIPWRCVGTQGVGAFYTQPMTETEACEHVKRLGHAVLHVDRNNAHIFYKAKV